MRLAQVYKRTMDTSTGPVLSGIDLKTARLRRGVRAMDVASRMGVSKQRVSQMEGAAFPTYAAIRRYLAALEALSDQP